MAAPNNGASIVGSTNASLVQVSAGDEGGYILQLTLTAADGTSSCAQSVDVEARTTGTPLNPQTVCPGGTVTFSTTPAGAGPFAFVWRKDGMLVDQATNNVLVLAEVAASDAGSYCVEIICACNSVTNCATLAVFPPPGIRCPPDLTVVC